MNTLKLYFENQEIFELQFSNFTESISNVFSNVNSLQSLAFDIIENDEESYDFLFRKNIEKIEVYNSKNVLIREFSDYAQLNFDRNVINSSNINIARLTYTKEILGWFFKKNMI